MRLLKPLLTIVLCLCLSFAVFAHPGRTDSNEGHTDHSTGEYHYHHGYSAHQHTDTDGDGKLDCPFRIKGSLENSKSENFSSAKIDPSKKKTTSSEKTKKKRSIEDYVTYGCLAIFLLGIVVDLVVDAIKRKAKK